MATQEHNDDGEHLVDGEMTLREDEKGVEIILPDHITEEDLSPGQIRKLTPYLDKITYEKVHHGKKTKRPLTNSMRAYVWYYYYGGMRNKALSWRKAYKGQLNRRNQKWGVEPGVEADVAWKTRSAVNGGTLHRKPYIQESLQILVAEIERTMNTELPMTLFERLEIQATYDPSMFINPDGSIAFKSWDDIPPKFRCCVEGAETKFYGKDAIVDVQVLKLVDRKWAMKELMKMFPNKFSPERIQHIHTTLDGEGNEVGFDPRKATDEELRASLEEMGR